MLRTKYNKINNNEFINRAKLIHENKYNYDKVIYINTHSKIKIFCNNCKEYFLQTPHHHNQNNGCPKCQSSKGEHFISKILQENNIEFIKQYKFLNQPKEIKRCKYDFYLPELNTIIEFHGQQHYKFILYFHKTNDNYLKSWYRDILKKEFCLNNNINFIEIKYNEDIKIKLEIENIIKSTINY